MKRLMIAFVVCFAIAQLANFLIHGLWLMPAYESLAHVFRPEEQMNPMSWVFMVTSAVSVALFCYIFTRGYENRGIGEGVRYGLMMGLFFSTVNSFDAYVVYPIPLHLAIKWFVSSMIVWVILGVVLSLIYKQED